MFDRGRVYDLPPSQTHYLWITARLFEIGAWVTTFILQLRDYPYTTDIFRT